MRIHKYSSEYKDHTQEDIDLKSDNNEEVGDIYYYEALKYLDCSNEDLRIVYEDDFDNYSEFEKFSTDIEDTYYKDSSDMTYPNSMPQGITKIFNVVLRGVTYKVLRAEDMGLIWYYFTKEFIEVYSEMTDTEVEYDEDVSWEWE